MGSSSSVEALSAPLPFLDVKYGAIDDVDVSMRPGRRRLSADQKRAARTMSRMEVRFLVDTYYQLQRDRIAHDAQVRQMKATGEPCGGLEWVAAASRNMEDHIKLLMDLYSEDQPVCAWARSIKGIGPVLAAGLWAHINIERAPTVGHIWSFAGLNPGVEWNKGEKRPWNARLRVLCWKIGESFVKVSGREGAVYGAVYRQIKADESRRNEAGEFAEQARQKLERFNIGKTTDAYGYYSQGLLPPAHIHARATRKAVKLFLSHWHAVALHMTSGVVAPLPYAIAHLGHAHVIPPPNYEPLSRWGLAA